MTEEQQRAVDTVDKAIIISANAGSGKTSTMVTRLVSIIQNGLAQVSEILALTFTKSASTEMKQRLVNSLQKMLSDNVEQKKYIEKQINELNVADISSLDSFCQKLIKKYFYVLNIDPNFNVIDEVESGYLKASALESTLIKYADMDEFKDFTQFLKDTKKLDNVSKLILSFAEFLFTVVDYKDFLNKAVDSKQCYLDCVSFLLNRFKDLICHYKPIFKNYLDIVNKYDYELLKPNCELVVKFCNQFNKFDYEEMEKLKYYPTFVDFPKNKKNREIEELELQRDIKKDLDLFEEDISTYLQIFCYGNLDETKAHFDNSFKSIVFLCKMTESFIDNYNELKQTRNVFDFTDLEDRAIEILQNVNVQNDVRSKYKFICVDEFQDTNEKQSALLSYICGEDNTFFVGDPKQSIYNFRQCDLKIFVRLIEEFKLDKSKLALSFNQNFRSHKLILQFVNSVFERIMTKDITNIDYKKDNRFENLKCLRFKMRGKIGRAKKVNYIDRVKIFVLSKKSSGNYLDNVILKCSISKVAHNFSGAYKTTKKGQVYSVIENQNNKVQYTKTTEGHIAVQYIMNFFDKKIKITDMETKQKRPVKFSDFVILLRNRNSFQMYINAFNEYSIPVSAKFKLNLIELPHIQMLINVLKCVSNIKQDLPLSASLKLIGGLSEEELYEVRQKYVEDYFYQSVDKFYKEETQNEIIVDKLKKFFDKIKEYKIIARNFNVSSLLNHIMKDNNLYNYFLSLEDGADLVEQINLFLSKLENKSFDENLDEFLQFIENYKKAFEVDFSTVSSENCVKITTIHDSKGLEYPITIVGGCGDSFNLSKRSDFVYSKELKVGCLDADLDKRVKYPTISNGAIFIQKQVEEILEEMRILYVALTRPKEYLALIGTESKLKGNLNDNYTILNCRSFFEFILDKE